MQSQNSRSELFRLGTQQIVYPNVFFLTQFEPCNRYLPVFSMAFLGSKLFLGGWIALFQETETATAFILVLTAGTHLFDFFTHVMNTFICIALTVCAADLGINYIHQPCLQVLDETFAPLPF